MRSGVLGIAIVIIAGSALCPRASGQDSSAGASNRLAIPKSDSVYYVGSDVATPGNLNTWGLDILLSNDGFGLGTFYRRQFHPDLYGFVSFSISDSKDGREVERFDPYTQVSFVPGKLNRFLVMPLTFGLQRRLFREDIMDTFRPYFNLGAGPALIFAAPFTEIVQSGASTSYQQVEFFKSLGKGRAHYTATAFLGVGANFGSDKSNLFGLNLRYYFTYLLSGGLPSLYNERTGEVAGTKKDFGGFFITLNVGTSF